MPTSLGSLPSACSLVPASEIQPILFLGGRKGGGEKKKVFSHGEGARRATGWHLHFKLDLLDFNFIFSLVVLGQNWLLFPEKRGWSTRTLHWGPRFISKVQTKAQWVPLSFLLLSARGKDVILVVFFFSSPRWALGRGKELCPSPAARRLQPGSEPLLPA